MNKEKRFLRAGMKQKTVEIEKEDDPFRIRKLREPQNNLFRLPVLDNCHYLISIKILRLQFLRVP